MTDKAKHGLANTLDQLVRQADAHPDQPQRQPLTRGLRVDVLIKDGQTLLQISRGDKWPSPAEWSTVAKYFPRPVPNVLARRIYDGGRYYLKASWATIIAERAELLAPETGES